MRVLRERASQSTPPRSAMPRSEPSPASKKAACRDSPSSAQSPRRQTRRASVATEAAHSLLFDPDIMSHVLSFHTTRVGGWCPALWAVGSVCKAWCDAVHRVRPSLEEWTEFRWDVPKISLRAMNSRTYSPSFTSGNGAYRWRLLLCVNYEEMLYSGEEDADEDAEPRAYLALYLEKFHDDALHGPPPASDGGAALPHLHPLLTQFELQVLNPAAEEKHAARAKNVDIGVLRTWSVRSVVFSGSLTTWGHPRFHEIDTLREEGWVDDADTLRLACHVRVRNGRGRCPAAHNHSLARTDPRRTYARYGGAWHCDVCGKSGKQDEAMWHCMQGCEYDLCTKCKTARERTSSLRSHARGGRAAASSALVAPSFWVQPPSHDA